MEVAAQHQARLPGGPLARPDERLALGQPARDPEHQREREVGRRVGEDVRACCPQGCRGRSRPPRPRCPPRPRSSRSRAGLGAAAISSASTGSVSSDSSPSSSGARASSSSRGGGSRSGQTSTSCSAWSLSSASPGNCRVTNTRAWAPIGSRSMARAGASGKTQEKRARATTTVALVANERSGSSDPGRCAECLRSFGAKVRRFDIEEIGEAVVSGVRPRGGGRRRRQHRPRRGGGRGGRHPAGRGPGGNGERLRATDAAARRNCRTPAGWRWRAPSSRRSSSAGSTASGRS